MKLKISVALFLILIMIATLVSAGDSLSFFMSKDQDYLAVGKVIQKNQEQYTIEITELIVESSNNTDISKTITVKISGTEFKVGDGIAISLDAYVGGYQLKNGVFKLTTNNTETLEVIPTFDTQDKAELAAVEVFLKSRGKIKNFAFISDTQAFISDPSNNMVSIYNSENGKTIPTQMEKNEKYIVKGTSKWLPALGIIIGVMVIVVIATNRYRKNKKHTSPSEKN